MAFIEGKWLSREDRSERIELLKEKIRKLKSVIDANKATSIHYEAIERDIKELRKLKRVHECEFDILKFALEYCGDELNPTNDSNILPKGVTYANSADFHKELYALLGDVSTGKEKSNLAIGISRGHAKTGIFSNIYPLHQIVYRTELSKYTMIVSETASVASSFLQWGKNQLKFNDKLREDFGELLYQQKSKNEADNYEEYITLSGSKVESVSSGGQLRGRRFKNTRPRLVILDDIDSNASTNTPELIEKTKTWFNTELLPSLDAKGRVLFVGTMVKYGCLLHYVLEERKDFKSIYYSAILSHPTRQDLWAKWRELYNSDDEEALEKSEAFYLSRKDEMDEGCKILWPQRWSYLNLMKVKEDVGSKAFASEYLNIVLDEESAVFKEDYFQYYDTLQDLKGYEFYGAIDIAMGKERGDYSVMVTMARNPRTGICYIADVFMERINPKDFLKEVCDRAFKYQYQALAVEAQQFQEFWANTLEEHLIKQGYPAKTRLKQVKQRNRKELRIESLLPDVQSGRIRFRRFDKEPLEQFIFFPNHKHDDFPDTVQMCYDVARSGNVSISTRLNYSRI